MSRLQFSDIKTEVIRGLGNPTDTNNSARVEQWIKQEYYRFSLTWHHPELDREDTGRSLAEGEASVLLPDDCYVVFGVGLFDPGTSSFGRWVSNHDARSIQSVYNPARSEPTGVARFGSTLRFNCAAEATYPLLIWYYRQPEAPDFTDGTSELGELWDDVLIQAALIRGHERYWRPDLAANYDQKLGQVLGLIPQPPLATQDLPDRPVRSLKSETFMGLQG